MGSVWKAPEHATPFLSPLPWPTPSTRLLWWGYSQGTPGTDWSLETPNMPARLFVCTEVKKKKKERERRRKGANSFVPGCIFLRLWFPSTMNVNKQSHERGKHGQSGGGKKTGGGGRKQSASKNILARCVRYKSPAHLLVSLPDKNTHSQATQIWLTDTPAHRGASVGPDTLLYQLVGQQLRTELLLLWGLNEAMVPNLRAETSQRVEGYISGVPRYQ